MQYIRFLIDHAGLLLNVFASLLLAFGIGELPIKSGTISSGPYKVAWIRNPQFVRLGLWLLVLGFIVQVLLDFSNADF